MVNTSIIINAPGDVTLRTSQMPQVRQGEALLRLLYGGICGSDLGSYRGSFAYVSYPRIPGHEFSAEIVEIEQNERGLKPGMVVTANPYFNCGKCYSCSKGRLNCCVNNQTMGAQRDGAFSEYISMPIERIYPAQGLDAKTLALVEPLCISYHGVKRAQVGKGDNVLIIGAGAIGILALISAKQAGANVYITDVFEKRLDVAKSLGADGCILNCEGNLEAEAQKITGGALFDVTIEAVGLPSTFKSSVDLAAFGGKVVLIGIGKKSLDFNFTDIQKKELNVYGSRNALRADFEEVIDLIKQGKLDPRPIVTHEFSFRDAPCAFLEADKNDGSMLKTMLRFE